MDISIKKILLIILIPFILFSSEKQGWEKKSKIASEIFAKPEAYKRYCGGKIKLSDEYYFPCVLKRFLNKKNTVQFLNSIPNDTKVIKRIYSYGPYDLYKMYLENLSPISEKNNAVAIKKLEKLILIIKASDGYIRGEMEGALLDIFKSKPLFIVKNWNIVKRYNMSAVEYCYERNLKNGSQIKDELLQKCLLNKQKNCKSIETYFSKLNKECKNQE